MVLVEDSVVKADSEECPNQQKSRNRTEILSVDSEEDLTMMISSEEALAEE